MVDLTAHQHNSEAWQRFRGSLRTCSVLRAAEMRDAGAIAAVHVASWQVAYRDLLPESVLTGLSVAGRERKWSAIRFVLPYLPESARQNEVVVDAIQAAATAFARGGYDVVVDGIVGPWFLGPFRAAAERNHLRMSYVVLRPTLEVTLSRAGERADDELADVDAMTSLYEEFAALDELEQHVIDTSDLDETQAAAEVRRAMASGWYRLA